MGGYNTPDTVARDRMSLSRNNTNTCIIELEGACYAITLVKCLRLRRFKSDRDEIWHGCCRSRIFKASYASTGITIAEMSVRLSVRPFICHTVVLYQNTAIISRFDDFFKKARRHFRYQVHPHCIHSKGASPSEGVETESELCN